MVARRSVGAPRVLLALLWVLPHGSALYMAAAPPKKAARRLLSTPLRYAAAAPADASAASAKAAGGGRAPKWRPGAPRREIERVGSLHPIFKLGLFDDALLDATTLDLFKSEPPLHFVATVMLLALALPAALPCVPLVVASRKALWARAIRASDAQHRAEFERVTSAYRSEQRALVARLARANAPGAARDALLPAAGAPFVVAVTMATGQEGQAVVRALALGETTRGAFGRDGQAPAATEVRALVRDPSSAKARALAALSPRVRLVRCDSTDAAALEAALGGAHAAYLCTTLNRAPAGRWQMAWDGGRYELEQGEAFAAAARNVGSLRQVVYGTAPLRKWPQAYVVEPPIHYAAKWAIEMMLTDAGLPVTFLRKCPYHENFTKLTKAEAKQSRLAPGEHKIKALTPARFEYNTLDPRDVGPWAALALAHPSTLVGASLSVAADCLSGAELAAEATRAAPAAFGAGVTFRYAEQPRWLFETLSFVEPTFVYIAGLQRWNSDGGAYDLDAEGVERLRALHAGTTWREHLEREGLGQFTSTMSELLPDVIKT